MIFIMIFFFIFSKECKFKRAQTPEEAKYPAEQEQGPPAEPEAPVMHVHPVIVRELFWEEENAGHIVQLPEDP